MTPYDEPGLRALYRMHAQDADRSTPPFAGMWRNAQARARTPREWSWRASFAAAAVVAAVSALALWWPRGAVEHAPGAITDWRSPTAFLLASPTPTHLSTLPTFGASPVLGSPSFLR